MPPGDARGGGAGGASRGGHPVGGEPGTPAGVPKKLKSIKTHGFSRFHEKWGSEEHPFRGRFSLEKVVRIAPHFEGLGHATIS